MLIVELSWRTVLRCDVSYYWRGMLWSCILVFLHVEAKCGPPDNADQLPQRASDTRDVVSTSYGSVIITLLIVLQVRRRDGSDCIHALPQNAGDVGNIRVLLLDALLLLHRR